jgi:two-component system, NtrC family, nitrogen regulation sensor histidine kinase NtrY
VTLAARLVLSLSIVVVLATSALGWFVHRSWRKAEENQFQSEFESAQERLSTQLQLEVSELPRLLQPLCEHSQMVDDPLLSLQTGGIPADRRHALSLLAKDTQRAYRFDEFMLFTGQGEVLGAHDASLVGSRDPSLAALPEGGARSEFVIDEGVPKVRAHCAKRDGKAVVGLLAARQVGELLERVGALHGLVLSLTPPDEPRRHLAKLELPMLAGTTVYASPQRSWLDAALASATRAILLWGAITLFGALFVGWLLARRLAIPIEQLAEQVKLALEGEPRPVSARGSREIVHFAEAFNRAISDLNALKSRLAATERLAAQREIARRVAHEIKNPLMPIRAAIETLRRLRRRGDPNFDSYFDEATTTVLSEVQRINTIVNEFTQFARLPRPNPSQFDLPKLLQTVASMYQHQSARVEVECRGEISTITADRDQLVQVLTNLVQNALDAIGEEPNAQVRLLATVTHTGVQIDVVDNGPGVPEALRENLFEPYVTGKRDGTGLGLAIARNIVTEHGGTIECVTAKGRGACFRVKLPVSGPVRVAGDLSS